jgi:hypothetical protein
MNRPKRCEWELMGGVEKAHLVGETDTAVAGLGSCDGMAAMADCAAAAAAQPRHARGVMIASDRGSGLRRPGYTTGQCRWTHSLHRIQQGAALLSKPRCVWCCNCGAILSRGTEAAL